MVKVCQADLQSTLNNIAPICNGTIPILEFLRVEFKKGKIVFSGTNIETIICQEIEADVENEDAFLVHAMRFRNIVNQFPDRDIELVSNERTLQLKAGDIECELIKTSVENYPASKNTEQVTSFSIDTNLLKDSIKKVYKSASLDQERYVLNSVNLNSADGYLYVNATDGRRLTKTVLNVENNDFSVILPLEIVKSIDTIDSEEVNVAIHENYIIFQGDNTTVTIQLIAGSYPDIDRVIPDLPSKSVSIPRLFFLDIVKRATVIASEDNYLNIKLKDNKLTVNTKSSYGNFEENMEITYNTAPIKFIFNSQFLIDALSKLDCDDFLLSFNDNESPIIIEDNKDTLTTLMPIRE